MARQSLGKWLSSLRVGQKIGLGYAFALGIAVSGTIVGFGVGQQYQKQAEEREEYARNEVELLQQLQSQVLLTRTHQQQLIPLTQNLAKFNTEYEHLLKHKTEIQKTWGKLKTFVAESAPDDHVYQIKIPPFLQLYDTAPERYSQELKRRIAQVRSLDLDSPANVEKAQALLLEFTNSELAIEFDEISDGLVDFIDEAHEELENAEVEQQEANKVSETIVIASIGLSVAIAILAAILTNKAIAQPIRSLTAVARQATEESNFDLRVTVKQSDEIGTLAHAFNRLIQSVKELLQQQQIANEQLELYSQTLESKVESRTQELNTTNTQLQQLLEELQRTQVQMVQSEKMSALGQMVAGVAHEINNPVNFIHGNLSHVQEYAHNLLEFVQIYRQHYPDTIPAIQAQAEVLDIEFIQTDLPKLLDSMQVGTDRIRQIVLSLRNFSRMDESELKTVDIHEGIDSTLLILQHRLKEKADQPAIQVVRDYGELPLVECYPAQLNQALMNILANAIDAVEEANAQRTPAELEDKPGRITIQTSLINDHWVNIAITDTGIGMPEPIRQHIFEPFFTTKAVGKGTGLGMPISYQILIEKHGGKLDCCSTPGEGTEFMIQIPVQQKICQVN